MRSLGTWFGRFAMAGACLAGTGCGGGDVPDPDSDSRAAVADRPSGPVSRGGPAAEPAAEGPAKSEPTAVAVNGPSPEAEKPGPSPATPSPSAAAKPPEPTEPEKQAPSKNDSSGTEDLLRMASNASPAPADSGPGGATAPGASTAPGGNAAAMATGGNETGPRNRRNGPGDPGGPGGAVMPGGPPPGVPGGPPGAPASGGGSAEAAIAPGPGYGQPGPGAVGAPGAPGAPGASGFGGISAGGADPGANLGPAAFNRPMTAVQAFLSAIKSKDKDRIAQATARRAPTEAAEKHRKLFASIFDGSITEDELDELAKSLDGFQVVQQLEAKSTGRINVVVAKMAGRDRLQATIITRKEKDGWKVMDVERMLEFKASPTARRTPRR